MADGILVIGDGHGAESLLRGLYKSGSYPAVCSSAEGVVKLATEYGLEVVDTIESWISGGGELIISSGYRSKIPALMLDRADFLNVHYALFPKYRGMHSIVWAILNGDRSIGITLHKMSEDLDAGPIVWQKSTIVGSRTSWESMLLCDSLIEKHIGKVLRKYMSGRLRPRPQRHHKATYVAKRNVSDCEVDWKVWDIRLFKRHIKALVSPYPLPFFMFRGNRFEIIEVRFRKVIYFEIPGHVVYVSGSEIFIKLIDGLAIIKRIRDAEGNIFFASDLISSPGVRLKKTTL